MSRLYFKMSGETDGSVDSFYFCEIEAGLVVRQIYEVDGCLYWARDREWKSNVYPMTDQPEIDMSDRYIVENLSPVELSRECFEALWRLARLEAAGA